MTIEERSDRPAGPEVRFESVSVRRRRRIVLHEVQLQFDSGVLTILGPNGAGKTTLMRLLAEGARPSSGRVLFDGSDVRTRTGASRLRANSGWQPQLPGLMPSFTVREAVTYAAWLKGVPEATRKSMVEIALQRTHLSEMGSARTRQLSGGERKRTAIAQAIVHQPALVILDEPTAALDPQERVALMQVISEIARSHNVIFSTHITSDLDRLDMTSHVMVLAAGRIKHLSGLGDFRALGADGTGSAWDDAYLRVMAS